MLPKLDWKRCWVTLAGDLTLVGLPWCRLRNRFNAMRRSRPRNPRVESAEVSLSGRAGRRVAGEGCGAFSLVPFRSGRPA